MPSWSDALKAVISAGVDGITEVVKAANAKAYEEAYKAAQGKYDERVAAQIEKNVDEWAEVSNDSMVETFNDELTNMIQTAQQNGTGTRELARQIDELFEGRGDLIARTEVQKAMMTGKFTADKDNGYTQKEWIHNEKGSTGRESHEELEEMGPIPIDEPFETDLGPIMYPGDPNADVGDLCNCGCGLISSHAEEDENE
jgi:hypothetical protein